MKRKLTRFQFLKKIKRIIRKKMIQAKGWYIWA